MIVETETKTHFKIVLIDETGHWCNSITSKTGAIQTAYIYDSLRMFNSCEITLSYELHPLYYVTENSVDDSVYEELEQTFGNENPRYVHCRTLDAYKTDFDADIESHEDESYEEILERRIEYERSNRRF